MYVCHCRAVTSTTVREAISDGARTVRQVADRCGASTDCGRCVAHVRELLEERYGPRPRGRLKENAMTLEDPTGPTQKVYLVSIYPVADYDEWKADLDRAHRALARLGVTRHWVLRGADDPKEITMILELPTREDAERLLRSTEIGVSAWMERMGLEIYPPFFLGEATEVREYPVPASDPGPPARP